MELSRASLSNVRKPPLAQVVLCSGCCCGKTERGFAPVPVEQLKSVWKAEKLNRTVQLTVSGCLGPCEMANVVLLLVPDSFAWLGGIRDHGFYEAILDWARRCHAVQSLLPPPDDLVPHQFVRFRTNCDAKGASAVLRITVNPGSGLPEGANL